jgi:hypothetical protein
MATKKTATSTASKTDTSPVIVETRDNSIIVRVGGADYIQNRFSQKAAEEMLRKHMGISQTREKKSPRQCYELSQHKNLDGVIAIDPVCFKSSMVSAAAGIKNLKKTQLRRELFVAGKSIPIQFEQRIPRMDITRTSGMNRTPDIRFRYEYRNWTAAIEIIFADTMSVETVIDLLHRAGRGGVGEWRPEKNGTHGTYQILGEVTDKKEREAVRKACMSPLESLTIPEWAMDAQIDPKLVAKLFGEGGMAVGQDDVNEGETEEEESEVA